MPIPNRRDDLQSFGYSYSNTARCGSGVPGKGCNAVIEWWLTPSGKKMPFTITMSGENEVLEPHWSSCPKADSFRRKK